MPELELSKITRLHLRLKVHEQMAAVYLRTADSVGPETIKTAQFIRSGSWRGEPLAVMSYRKIYGEFLAGLPEGLTPDQVPEILGQLGRFYDQLFQVWVECGILERSTVWLNGR